MQSLNANINVHYENVAATLNFCEYFQNFQVFDYH